MMIINISKSVFFNPLLDTCGWLITAILPVVILLVILLPFLLGKKGVVISSLLSFAPLVITLPVFFWTTHLVKSSLDGSFSEYLEMEIYSSIATQLSILLLGSLYTSITFITTVFSSIISKKDGRKR